MDLYVVSYDLVKAGPQDYLGLSYATKECGFAIPILELARIGSLLFIFAGSPGYQTGSSSPIETFATRLSAQPLRRTSENTPSRTFGE
jgi:hypothetical protein